jgi:hypothetical protein
MRKPLVASDNHSSLLLIFTLPNDKTFSTLSAVAFLLCFAFAVEKVLWGLQLTKRSSRPQPYLLHP